MKHTKLRVLRGAVQDNFEVVHGIKIKPPLELKRPQRHWLWGLLLVAGIAYIAAPSLVISVGETPAPAVSTPAVAPETPQNVDPSVGSAVENELLLPQPQPLNRDVFPL